jgi:hypothetical protein
MTNKEKYPNAHIGELYGEYYVALGYLNGSKKYHYLVGDTPRENATFGYHKTKEAAQLALDNFLNEKKPITLDEIKSQLIEAKKLIGKTVRRTKGDRQDAKFKVESVVCNVDEFTESGPLSRDFFDKNGYLIRLRGEYLGFEDNTICAIYSKGYYEVVNDEITVTNHLGEKYTAQDNGQTWKFGCAEISKSLVRELYGTMSKTHIGNRQATKVTIGAADFSLDTLKALVELEEENRKQYDF